MAHEKDNKMEKHMDTEQKVQKRIILAFGVIGFLVDFFFSTYQSAAQDIFEGTNIPTPWITLSIAAPACLVTFIYPYVFQRVPVSVACFVLFIASVAGILLTSLAQDLRVRLSGVCLVSFGIGSMEAVFLSLSSVYGGQTVHSYSMGSALSFVAGPLSYAGLTMFACWSPDFSFLILTALWIFLPISYILLNGCSNSHSPTSYKEVPYIPLQSDATQQPGVSKLSFNDMLVLTWKTQEQFIPLFVGIFCKTLLIGGVVTTIAFSNIPITPRNQYLLYTLASGIGDLLSRPYLVYLSLCAIGDKFVVKKTWVPALLTVFITMFMVCDSWFRLIPEFSFALVLVLFNTFLQGIVYVNSFLNAGEGLSVEEKRFCRALIASAIWLPNVVGGLIGLDTEIQLRQHCLLFHTEAVCYTRSHTVWNPNVSCVI